MDIYSESGRIKSLEKRFLTYQQIQKLIEVKSLTEFVALTGKSFYKLPSNVSSAEEVSEFFNKERENFYREVEKYAPSLLKIFLLKNDFFNLKLIAEGKENFVYPGNLPGQILKRSVEERKIEVPDFLKKGVEIVKGKKDIEEKLLNLKNEYYIQIYKTLSSFLSSTFDSNDEIIFPIFLFKYSLNFFSISSSHLFINSFFNERSSLFFSILKFTISFEILLSITFFNLFSFSS